MSIAAPVSNEMFRETIDRAVKDVYKTMASFNAMANPGAETLGIDGLPVDHAVAIQGVRAMGTVGFIGNLNGLLSLIMDEELAVATACHMLGMTPDELQEAGHEVLNDTIGEITNMTAGAFKNQLADRGYPCKLTVPSILRGDTLSLETTRGSVRRVYRYSIEQYNLLVDFQLKDGTA